MKFISMKFQNIITLSIFVLFVACSLTAKNSKYFEDVNKKSEKYIQELFKDSTQKYAIFYADTAYMDTDKYYQKIKLETKWIINNQTLTYGSKPIKVIPNPYKIDTILFRQNNEHDFDTIICNIANPYSYKFVFNECCRGFNVRSDSIKNRPSLLFKLNAPKNEEYLGILGSSGKLLTQQDTIKDFCKSALTPNIYRVELLKINDCEGDDCKGLMCLIENDSLDSNYRDYSYQVNKEVLSFLFMPLNNEPLEIFYDVKEQKIRIQ